MHTYEAQKSNNWKYRMHLSPHDLRRIIDEEVELYARVSYQGPLSCRKAEVFEDRRLVDQGLGGEFHTGAEEREGAGVAKYGGEGGRGSGRQARRHKTA